MTLREIADIEGISKQRVAEILETAMRKVKKILQAKGIRIEDLL